MGRAEQIERKMDHMVAETEPWKRVRRSYKWIKQQMHKRERRRWKNDPDCVPEYRKYSGWIW